MAALSNYNMLEALSFMNEMTEEEEMEPDSPNEDISNEEIAIPPGGNEECQGQDPVEMDSVLLQIPEMVAQEQFDGNERENQPSCSPTPSKRKRGRPKKLTPIPSSSAAVIQPHSPPRSNLSAEEMENYNARTDRRQMQLQEISKAKNISAVDKQQQKWEVLVEADRDRHQTFGAWLWEPMTDPTLNSDIPFTGHSGFSAAAQRATSELDCLKLYLKNSVWDNITRETNNYALQLKGGPGHFDPVTREELMAFIGLTIGMGIMPRPSITDYWLTSEIFHIPFFTAVMSRNRYQEISRFLHVADNERMTQDSNGKAIDKLFKVRPLLDQLVESFALHYKPDQDLSIDERTIGTKCRLHFLQYMKFKSTTWGVKLWALCDVKTNYLLNFQIYTGKENVENSLSFHVVNDLMTPFNGKGHRVYMDNFYTSPTLLRHLCDYKTLAAGPVCPNRVNMPGRLDPSNHVIDKGQGIFLKSHGMTACRWKAKKDVLFLSTIHGNQMEEVVRCTKNRHETQKNPSSLVEYNNCMGGVDGFDQLLSYYPLSRMVQKWWKKVFWQLIDMTIGNAYILYKAKTPECQTHKSFRENLALQLCQPLRESRAEKAAVGRDSDERLQLAHEKSYGSYDYAKQCRVCRMKTSYGCFTCGATIRLHPGICAGLYHSYVDYKQAYEDRQAKEK